MFQIGDYIVYGCKGIFKIEGITKLEMSGVSKEREYFVLEPTNKKGGSIYAPADKTDGFRHIMTREEADSFINDIPKIEVLTSTNNKVRDEAFKEKIKSNDPYELMTVIKTLFFRRNERLATGKKLTLTDLHFMQQAESILFEELAIILGKERDTIPSFLESVLGKDSSVEVQ